MNYYHIIYSIQIVLILYIIYLILHNNTKEYYINHENRKCFSSKMSTEEKNRYKELLKITFTILDKNNIDWIPVSGNLLSVFRNNSLFIKWDDDYDIVIRDIQVKNALQILESELPKYGAHLLFFRNYENGKLYKISFTNKSKKYISTFKTYTWPFIDIFVDLKPYNNATTSHNLNQNEYPLLKKKIEGITIPLPSKGPRSYEAFQKEGFFDICKEQDWVHSLEKSMPCTGKKEISCNLLTK